MLGAGAVMRVLLLCDWFLKYVDGLARSLADGGAEVTLLCRDHAREFDDRSTERLQLLDGLRSHGVEVLVLRGRTSSPSGWAATVPLRRRIDERRPEIVHAQANYEPRLLALSLRHPTVLTVHDPVPHPGQPGLGRAQQSVSRLWLRRADRIIVHGEALQQALPPRVRGRSVVIPHGVSPAAQPLPVPPSPVVALLGRLEPYKGVEVLVDAMPKVWRARPEVRLVVAGLGPSSAAVPDDPRIERRFEYVPEAELPELLARVSLVVLPYTEASQTGVGSLAVAAGVPVLVTDVGALADIAPDSSFVVPPGDPLALAAGILRHLDDGDETRRAVWQVARDRLSWSVVAARHLSLYEDVLARHLKR
jgi:glycosyltransferase involved in cell wall biosynthesis